MKKRVRETKKIRNKIVSNNKNKNYKFDSGEKRKLYLLVLLLIGFVLILGILINTVYFKETDKEISLSPDINSNLIGWWKFENNFDDSSGNGYNGIAVSNPTFDSGLIGQTGKFDGLNDYVKVNSIPDLKYEGGDLTISLWMKPDTTETDGSYLISKPWNSNGQYNYRIYYQNNKILFYVGGATGYINYSSPFNASDEWHHVVAKINSSKAVEIYVDGVRNFYDIHNINSWIPLSGDQNLPLTFGTVYPYAAGWGGNLNYSFNGSIDEIRIYKRDLSSDEITDLYYYGRSQSCVTDDECLNGYVCQGQICQRGTRGLVAYWPFEGNTNDFTTNNNDGTPTGITYIQGINASGQAALFDQGSDVITVPHSSSIAIDDDITISFWIKADSLDNSYADWIIAKHSGSTVTNANYRIYLFQNYSSYPERKRNMFGVYANSMNSTGAYLWNSVSGFTDNVQIGRWYHVVWTYNSSRGGQIYLNGIPRGGLVGRGKLNVSEMSLYMAPLNSFIGALDEVRIYNKIISDDEILDLYDVSDDVTLCNDIGDTACSTNQYCDGIKCVEGNRGLIASYDYEGNVNDGTGKHNGTLSSPEMFQFTQGKFNKAATFKPNNTYVGSVILLDDLHLLDSFSISAWFNTSVFDNNSNNNRIIGDRGTSSYGNKGFYVSASGQETFHLANGTNYGRISYFNSYNDSQWHHIATIYNSTTKESRLYIDGILRNSSINNSYSVGEYPLSIGALAFSGSLTHAYNGSIDRVRIYNTLLTPLQVLEEYTLGGKNECYFNDRYCGEGLAAYFPFDGDFLDYSGNRYHGNETGGINFSKGVMGESANFDGINDFVNVQNLGSRLQMGRIFSISLWLKTSSSNGRLFSEQEQGQINTPGFDKDTVSITIKDGKICSHMLSENQSRTGGNGKEICTPENYNDNTWHYVVIIREENETGPNGNHTLYVDDQFIKTDLTGGIYNDGKVNLTIGADYSKDSSLFYPDSRDSNSSYNFFKGSIDELRIYNRTLNKSEISIIYSEYPRCGDSACNFGESCSSCSQDCGTCSDDNNGNNKGNGGSGCVPKWECEYGECIDNIQKYICVDLHNCRTQINKPVQQDKSCSINLSCVDNDGDSYGVGDNCIGLDLDDNNSSVTNTTGNVGQKIKGNGLNIILFSLIFIFVIGIVIIIILFIIKLSRGNRKDEGESFIQNENPLAEIKR
ncbi:hypothetical protein COU57_00290 [Candidatus Pacearchaeota archaeon CG10_big_fil_rev_8_21_14_0_10_32_14]|nr:MAG: hypothetical protein COU57_00290 [Candidatus Pacearchaeota archaeon CG10_big_fil_rev_8_21_14_0_10_32_14]